MTDERHDTVPATDVDGSAIDRDRRGPDPVDDDRARGDDDRGEEERHPLLREGADALDAADIADPDEQL